MDNEILEAANILWSINNNNIKCCQICKVYSSPAWRKYAYYTQLCNKCGLHMKNNNIIIKLIDVKRIKKHIV
jgi:hypothetical protein